MKIQDLIVKTEKVKWQDLKDLQPENLKTNFHSEKTKKSIIELGFAQAIYVWQNPETQEIKIIDGHLRSDLLRELVAEGFEVPEKLNCTFLDNTKIKTEQEAIKYLLRVFNVKRNPIDSETLENWLEDVDLSVDDVAFDDLDLKFEVEDILEVENLEPSEKDDEVREPAEKYTFVNKGDVWLLGKHRLACGDSTVITDVEKLMDGKKADMVFTDPPYNTGMKANSGSTWLSHMFNDSFTDEQWENLMSGFCASIFYALKENSVAYICLDWRRNYELIPHIKRHFDLSNIIIWDKMVHGLGSDYKYTYEVINVCKKGKPKLTTNQGEQDYQDVWHIQRKIGRDEEHATKKPIEIITRAISHATQNNNLVLDLFAGSGSTLIACEKTKRICYTMELDEHYCGVVVNRYKDFVGSDKEIFLLKDGKKIPYAEVINKQPKTSF